MFPFSAFALVIIKYFILLSESSILLEISYGKAYCSFVTVNLQCCCLLYSIVFVIVCIEHIVLLLLWHEVVCNTLMHENSDLAMHGCCCTILALSESEYTTRPCYAILAHTLLQSYPAEYPKYSPPVLNLDDDGQYNTNSKSPT